MSNELANVSYTAIFPILASNAVKEYFAGPFISMISTPGVSYVTIKNDNGDSYDHLMTAIGNTWPLLVLSVLLSLNSGFVVWLLVSASKIPSICNVYLCKSDCFEEGVIMFSPMTESVCGYKILDTGLKSESKL